VRLAREKRYDANECMRSEQIKREMGETRTRLNSQKKAVLPLQFQADALIIYVLRMFMTSVKIA
jgi:hypothetical protein